MPSKDTDERQVIVKLPAGNAVVDKDISTQRRKIIRASAAVVPAILTIRSGVAVAMTSLNQCVERDAARADLLPESEYAIGAPDEWVRMEAWRVVIGNNPSTILYGVPDNGVVPGLLDSYSVWYDETGSTVDSNGHLYKVNSPQFDAGQVVYLLCYVDAESGSYNWYPQQPILSFDQSASAITGSCLCSVNPDFTMG